ITGQMHPPSHLAQPLFLTLDPRVPQTEAMGPPMSSAQPARAHLDSGPRPLMLPAHNEPQGPRGRRPQPTPCGHHPAPPSCSSPTPRDTARSVPQTLRHQTSCGHRATRGPQVRSRPTSTQPTRGGCFSLTPSLARLLNPDTPAPNFRASPGQTGQSLSALSCPIRDAPPLPTHQAHQALHPGRVTPCPELPKQASGRGSQAGAGSSPRPGQPSLPGGPPCGPSWAGAALRGPPSPPRVQGQCRSLPGGGATPNITHHFSTGAPFTACDTTGSPTRLPLPGASLPTGATPQLPLVLGGAGVRGAPGGRGASVWAPRSEFYSHSGAVSPPPGSQLPPPQHPASLGGILGEGLDVQERPISGRQPLLMLTKCCTENIPRSDHRPQIPKSLSQDWTSASPALPISMWPCVASLTTRDSGLFPRQAPHKQHHLSPNLAGTPIPRAPSPGLLGAPCSSGRGGVEVRGEPGSEQLGHGRLLQGPPAQQTHRHCDGHPPPPSSPPSGRRARCLPLGRWRHQPLLGGADKCRLTTLRPQLISVKSVAGGGVSSTQ
ncbi:hypothetical protein EI555_013331, partial [Monodon monoceros]